MIDESYLIEGASGDFLFIEGVGLKSEGLGKVELFVSMVVVLIAYKELVSMAVMEVLNVFFQSVTIKRKVSVSSKDLVEFDRRCMR